MWFRVTVYENHRSSNLLPTWKETSEESLFFHFLIFCWSWVDLKCCDNFCCTKKWFSDSCTHIHSLPYSFTVYIITHNWIKFYVLYSRSFWPVISYSTICICQSQTPSLSLSCNPSPLLTIILFTQFVSLIFCSTNMFSCILFESYIYIYKWCHVTFVFYYLISLSVIISKSINVAAKGIISLFMA